MKPEYITTIPNDSLPALKNWKEILEVTQAYFYDQNRWIFRGQLNSKWPLSTSLERVLEAVGMPIDQAWRIEGGLIRRFQRQAYNYITALPPEDKNFLEWLSWMQHFGAPTRLMDWTHSFYVGLFFAIKDLWQDRGSEAAIWAINWHWIEEVLHEKLNSIFHTDTNLELFENFDTILGPSAKPGIVKVNAFRLNPRLVIQQGTFICPTNINLPFSENLISALESTSSSCDFVIKVRVSDQARNDIIRHLFRMNISEATLFPDLSGFAASLRHFIVFDDLLWPHTKWR